MTAAGWYNDPTGRSQVRYFDGSSWTDNVAANGQATLDPVAPIPAATAGATVRSGRVGFAESASTTRSTPPARRRWSTKRLGILVGAGIVGIAVIASVNTSTTPAPVPTTGPALTVAVTTIAPATTSATAEATSVTSATSTPPTTPSPTTAPSDTSTIAAPPSTSPPEPSTVEADVITSAPVAPQPLVSTPKTTAASTYYANCSEARAAGAAPLHQGEPGYSPRLDRDGDGIACE